MDKFADFRKLSGNTLKIIACVTMFIDHIGAAILLPLIKDGILPVGMSFATIKIIYRALRCIGRTSFPLFIFVLHFDYNTKTLIASVLFLYHR